MNISKTSTSELLYVNFNQDAGALALSPVLPANSAVVPFEVDRVAFSFIFASFALVPRLLVNVTYVKQCRL